MKEWISKALSETNGNPSSLRVPFWAWEIVLILTFIGVVVYALFSHFQKPESAFNPIGTLGSILAFLGANRASKAVQKSQENNIPPPIVTENE